MNKLIIGITLIILSGAIQAEMFCPSTNYDGFELEGKPTKDIKSDFQSSVPIFKGGKVSCKVSDYSYKGATRRQIEMGTYKGKKYYIGGNWAWVEGKKDPVLSRNGFPVTGNWTVSCDVDEMEESRSLCSLSKGYLTIYFGSDGSPQVMLGVDIDTVGKLKLKVDKNAVYTGNTSSDLSTLQSRDIVEEFIKGDEVLIRYTKRYNQSRDKRVSLYGFSAAYEILVHFNKIIKQPAQFQ